MNKNKRINIVSLEERRLKEISSLKNQLKQMKNSKKRKNKNKKLSRSQSANITNAPSFTTQAPKTKASKNGVILSHTEYIGIPPENQNAFTVKTLGINPSDPAVFPWLSNIAVAFEKYRFRKLQFRYVTRSSTLGQGTVVMFVDMDVTDSAPESLDQIFNTGEPFYQAGTPYTSFTFRVPINKFRQLESYLVRNPSITYTPEQRLMYDPANFSFGTEGTGDAILGFVFVDYEIELMVPTIENIPNVLNLQAVINNMTLDWNMNFSTGTAVAQAGNMDIRLADPDPHSFKFKQSCSGYLTIYLVGSGFDITRNLVFTPHGAISITEIGSSLDDNLGGTDTWVKTYYVVVSDSNAYLTQSTGLVTGNTDSTLFFYFSSAKPVWMASFDSSRYPLSWQN